MRRFLEGKRGRFFFFLFVSVFWVWSGVGFDKVRVVGVKLVLSFVWGGSFVCVFFRFLVFLAGEI